MAAINILPSDMGTKHLYLYFNLFRSQLVILLLQPPIQPTPQYFTGRSSHEWTQAIPHLIESQVIMIEFSLFISIPPTTELLLRTPIRDGKNCFYPRLQESLNPGLPKHYSRHVPKERSNGTSLYCAKVCGSGEIEVDMILQDLQHLCSDALQCPLS
ncbi:unnamed protein product [Lepeophtheirus salmonis]|uniref:(salmon louse) hypothetical protein n=1 Tax=Lepeophtheirus salmonis TaxID=72036 RepID=A0A7R8H5V1_LEPSM|nr:unnamed protein product [Lepeophtheirus salmonis]CAF2887502.1 unnamed protein product [Lepeophtheirus salmonis]